MLVTINLQILGTTKYTLLRYYITINLIAQHSSSDRSQPEHDRADIKVVFSIKKHEAGRRCSME